MKHKYGKNVCVMKLKYGYTCTSWNSSNTSVL